MNLFLSTHNCIQTASKLIKHHRLSISNLTIQTFLETHPDYPSLLCISDLLNKFNVGNIALKTRVENFSVFPAPFVAHVIDDKTGDKSFSIIHGVEGGEIFFQEPSKNKIATENIENFERKFLGHVLIIDSSEKVEEHNYSKKIAQERVSNAVNFMALLFFPLIIIGCILYSLFTQMVSTIIFPSLFLSLSLLGASLSFALVLFEIDSHNPLLKEICHPSKHVNCGAVLGSKASKIKGISWSYIGFCYFSGIILMQLILGINSPEALHWLRLLSTASLISICLSIYYQWRIVRQWCLLCVAVQTTLFSQFIIAFSGDFPYNLSYLGDIFLYSKLLVFVLYPVLSLCLVIPMLQKAREGREHYNSLQRLKNNRQVFDGLLSKEKEILFSTDGLGITLGNPNAKWTIIKVCNPYCGPCARAHPLLEELVTNNGNVKLQIIFTTSGNDTDASTSPVQHLLAISSHDNESITKQALDDWYNQSRDYKIFAEKYPISSDLLVSQKSKIVAMRKWCDSVGIRFTPTIFVNGSQLPDIYSISDLRTLLYN